MRKLCRAAEGAHSQEKSGRHEDPMAAPIAHGRRRHRRCGTCSRTHAGMGGRALPPSSKYRAHPTRPASASRLRCCTAPRRSNTLQGSCRPALGGDDGGDALRRAAGGRGGLVAAGRRPLALHSARGRKWASMPGRLMTITRLTVGSGVPVDHGLRSDSTARITACLSGLLARNVGLG